MSVSASFTTKFDLSGSAKIFSFTDTTDYIGGGVVSESTVNGCFTITAPSGTVVYNNTDFTDSGCDIKVSTDRDNQRAISLPVGADRLPESGTYTILYTVHNTVGPAVYTVTNTYTYAYVAPVVSIRQAANVFVAPQFTSTDTTNYIVNSITPTISRVHKVIFPYTSAGVPVAPTLTGSAAVITTSSFYTGTQTSTVNSTLTYTFTDGLIVSDVVSGSAEYVVSAESTCEVYCGLKSLYTQMKNALTSNYAQYQTLSAQFSAIMSIITLADKSLACGESNDFSGYVALAKQIGNFTDDCCCGDSDEPTLIVGVGTSTTFASNLSYSFATSTTPYIKRAGTISSATPVAYFIFEGTDYIGQQPSGYELLSASLGSSNVDVIIKDETNNLQIAFVSTHSASQAIADMIIQAQAPASRAVFSISIVTQKSGEEMLLSGVNIKF